MVKKKISGSGYSEIEKDDIELHHAGQSDGDDVDETVEEREDAEDSSDLESSTGSDFDEEEEEEEEEEEKEEGQYTKFITQYLFNYLPKLVGGGILEGANVPRFFSGEKACGEFANIDNEPVQDTVGASCWNANAVLGVYGLYNFLKMLREKSLRFEPLFLVPIITTAFSDVYNGIVLSSNPITKAMEEGELWAILYTYASAAVVFGTSFCVNIISIWDSYALLFHRDKEDIIHSEALRSLSYSLIGRNEKELTDFKNKIVAALETVFNARDPENPEFDPNEYAGEFYSMGISDPDEYTGAYSLDGLGPDEQKNLLPLLGINLGSYSEEEKKALKIKKIDLEIARKVYNLGSMISALNQQEMEDFINYLRKDGFSISTTSPYEFLWFMKQLSIALAVPSAIALFYGPRDLTIKFFGDGRIATTGADVAGLCPIPVKTAVYYKLNQALFFKLCHVRDTIRNILFIETKNESYFPILKTGLIVSAAGTFYGWIFTSGVGFYFSVTDFCKMILNGYTNVVHPDTSSDGGFDSNEASDGIDDVSLAARLTTSVYAYWGTLNACLINLSSVVTMTEVVLEPHLSKGYNPLSRCLNARGQALGSKMPAKTPSQKIVDSAYSCISRGSPQGDEEDPRITINDADPLYPSSSSSSSSSSPNYGSFPFFSPSSSASGPLGCMDRLLGPLTRCFGY